jgi:hypothetical protein
MTYFIITLLLFCFGLLAFFLLCAVALGVALLFCGRQGEEVEYSIKNAELENEPGKIFPPAGKERGLQSLGEKWE